MLILRSRLMSTVKHKYIRQPDRVLFLLCAKAALLGKNLARQRQVIINRTLGNWYLQRRTADPVRDIPLCLRRMR